VISLLAVTRQGPAQGGKAGGTRVPEKIIAAVLTKLSNTVNLYKSVENSVFSYADNQAQFSYDLPRTFSPLPTTPFTP
jgi:hypothetical protein